MDSLYYVVEKKTANIDVKLEQNEDCSIIIGNQPSSAMA